MWFLVCFPLFYPNPRYFRFGGFILLEILSLAILDCFWLRVFRRARIPVYMHSQINLSCIYYFISFSIIIPYMYIKYHIPYMCYCLPLKSHHIYAGKSIKNPNSNPDQVITAIPINFMWCSRGGVPQSTNKYIETYASIFHLFIVFVVLWC